jgi:hypothetical protein
MNILNILRKPKLAVFASLLMLFFSCTNGNEGMQDVNGVFKITKVTNKKTINSITNSLNEKLDYKKASSDFDFTTISEIHNTETGDLSYMVESTNNENIKLGIYPKPDGDYTALKVEEFINNNFKTIIYKNMNDKVLTEILFNLEDGTMTVVKSSSEQNKCSGTDVAQCVDTNYNDNGWWGVTGYVITLFNPWFGVAVVAGCAAYECL